MPSSQVSKLMPARLRKQKAPDIVGAISLVPFDLSLPGYVASYPKNATYM